MKRNEINSIVIIIFSGIPISPDGYMHEFRPYL